MRFPGIQSHPVVPSLEPDIISLGSRWRRSAWWRRSSGPMRKRKSTWRRALPSCPNRWAGNRSTPVTTARFSPKSTTRAVRFPNAERDATDAVAVSSLYLPSHYAVHIRALAALGRSYIGQGKWTEAEKALARALDLQDLFKVRMPDDQGYAEMAEDYARTLRALNRGDEAARWASKAASIEVRQETRWDNFGSDFLSSAHKAIQTKRDSYEARIEAHFEAGDFVKEHELRKEYFALLCRLLGPSAPRTSFERAAIASVARILTLSPEQQTILRQARLACREANGTADRGSSEASSGLYEEAWRAHQKILGADNFAAYHILERWGQRQAKVDREKVAVRMASGSASGPATVWQGSSCIRHDNLKPW